MTRPYYKNPDEAFEARKGVNVDGCWYWTGAKSPQGYGQLRTGGVLHQAHVWGYRKYVGEVPDGLELDHLCKHRNCVNPFHLEPVTRRVNTLRGGAGASCTRRAANRLTCTKGHPFTEENTRKVPRGSGWARCCRICDRERAKKRREAK